MGSNYNSYREALDFLNLETLKDRRTAICTTFAMKTYNHPKFSSWFCTNAIGDDPRPRDCKIEPNRPYLKPVEARTKNFKKSPIPYLTNLLNAELPKKQK